MARTVSYWYTVLSLICAGIIVLSVGGIFCMLPEVDFYGDEADESRDEHLVEQFQYGIQNLRVASTTAGTGSVTTPTSMVSVATGTTLGSSASIQSRRYIRYQPARQGYAIFSARFTTGAAGTTQWIGCFDSSDGFAIGYNGTVFSLLYRNSVTGSVVDTIVAQSNFNGDLLDGNGSSGILLDPTKLNIFRIHYSWLGAAPIQFEIMDSNGVFVTFHTIAQANIFTTPSLSLPQLPMRAEVANAGAANNVSIVTAGWNAGIIDTYRNPSNARIFTVSGTIPSLTVAAGEVHIFTIQNPTTFAGKTNKIEARICMIGGGSTDVNATARGVTLRLRQNATVTGTSFSAVNSGNSIMNISTAGTYTAGTGTLVVPIPTTAYGNATTVYYFGTQENVIEIVILPGETLTVTAITTSNTVVPIIAVLGWDERF